MPLANSDLLVVQKADSGDLRKITVSSLMSEATGDVNSVNGKIGIVVLDAADVGALQSGDDVSDLNNDAGYITSSDIPAVPVDSVNSKTGVVVLNASDVGAATTAQGENADSAVQPGDNISDLNNDAGFITAADVPVASVNGYTGTVVLDASDVGALPDTTSLDFVPLTSWSTIPALP